MTILIGDIGGTKTILALVTGEDGARRPVAESRFASREYASLEEIVARFRDDHRPFLDQEPLTTAAFGVAGPIVDNVARITNLPWTIARDRLAAELDLPASKVRLLNDLEAIAAAVPHLSDDDLMTLNAGKMIPHAPLAVLAPGTGLGQAYLTWDGRRYRPHPSEGGHTDFAPGDPLQLRLLNYLSQTYEHVSTERVCSGLGIPNIYRFLRDEGLAEEPDWLAAALAEAADPVPIIMENGSDPGRAAPICRQTLETFVSILGAEAGNLALTLLAQGGVYLAGGIPPRILPALRQPHFLAAFTNKGRFREMMAGIPVHVILNQKSGLLGAAHAALELLE